MRSNKIVVVIPARYASTRLPGKPLLEVDNKPIIQWVYERASRSKLAGKVIVATDEYKIYNAVKAFGGNVVMTSPTHNSGSDRISEVVLKDAEIEIIVNVQGDEPLISPESIDKSIEVLLKNDQIDISTLIRKINDKNEVENPNLVKVVFDSQGNALYFSRSPIPYARNEEYAEYYGHIGLYAYKRESLLKMVSLDQSSYELSESLEQLRALQNGMKIGVIEVDYTPIGIDTPEDFEKFKELLKNKLV
ncbi:MAG: 3-deoxy-manno-octulosonate cytidylyltransferase [bacterium]